MKTKKISLLLIIIFLIPEIAISVGRKYEPEETAFDRRKRIVIKPICRLVKETNIPGDVIASIIAKKVIKIKIYLRAPGNTCQKEITCPKSNV